MLAMIKQLEKKHSPEPIYYAKSTATVIRKGGGRIKDTFVMTGTSAKFLP
jgi:hypothetical protein